MTYPFLVARALCVDPRRATYHKIPGHQKLQANEHTVKCINTSLATNLLCTAKYLSLLLSILAHINLPHPCVVGAIAIAFHRLVVLDILSHDPVWELWIRSRRHRIVR